MARKKKRNPHTVETADGRVLNVAGLRISLGTYPGQNRARRFADRKKVASKKACRKGGWQ